MVVQKGRAKWKHCWVTFLTPLSCCHQTWTSSSLPAASSSAGRGFAPSLLQNPSLKHGVCLFALFALEGFQCSVAAEASHQRVWRMAHESGGRGTQRSAGRAGSQEPRHEGRSLQKAAPSGLSELQTQHLTDRLMGSISPSSETGLEELVNWGKAGTTCMSCPKGCQYLISWKTPRTCTITIVAFVLALQRQ